MNNEKRVFHFSGGRSSAYMVLHFYKPGDLVVFCDTQREHSDTYRFINDFETNTRIPIIRLVGDFQKDVIKKEQMVPNRHKRRCTQNLKIRKARRFLRSIGWYRYTQFVGFRADEKQRVDNYSHRWHAVTTIFPMYEAGIKKPEILLYFKAFVWDLKIPSILGNCVGCFQKGESALMAIYQNEPSAADVWIDDEENVEINPNGYTYFKNTTHRQLRDKAKELKTSYNLDDVGAKFNCACTS